MHTSLLSLLTLLTTTTTALALPRPFDRHPVNSPPPNTPTYEPIWWHWPGWGVPGKDGEWSNAQTGQEQSGTTLKEPDNAAAETVAARDVPEVDAELAGVYICKDVAWGGDCKHHYVPLGSAPENCTVIDKEASSIGPDEGFNCVFYTNALCTPLASDGSDTLPLSFPGTANLLVTEKGDYNDRLLSFQCFKDDDVDASPVVPELGVPPNIVPPTEDGEEVVDEEDEEDGGQVYAVPDGPVA